MELPQPPQDTDLRNIIDKLAQFVARNGPEFEQMTKSKQKNNPKFSFLYGGEHFNYYQYKVTTEQAILKQSSNRHTDNTFSSQFAQQCQTGTPVSDSTMPAAPPAPSISLNAGLSNLPQWLAHLQQADQSIGNLAMGNLQQMGNLPKMGNLPQMGNLQQQIGNVPQMSNVTIPPPMGNLPQMSNIPPPMGNLPQMSSLPPPMGNLPEIGKFPQMGNVSTDSSVQTDAYTGQQAALQDQIKQSEANLSAQHEVLMQQQQNQIQEAVLQAQADMIQKLAEECSISLTDFDAILQPIIDSCTKDSISAGKGWILSHVTSTDAGKAVSQYLLKKSTVVGASFTQKLHIIYLINDVLHHCARKNADDLKKCLESVVVPMFCNASLGIAEEQESKLNKLLKLWESKSNYFDASVIEKMKSPEKSYQEYQVNLISQYTDIISPLTLATKTTFENYEKQHRAFVAHTLQQIQQLEVQKKAIEEMSREQQNPPAPPPPQTMANLMQQNSNYGQTSFSESIFNQQSSQMHQYDPQNYGTTNQQMYSQDASFNNQNDMSLYDYDQSYSQNSNSNPANNNGEESMSSLPGINLSQPPPGFFDDSGSVSFQNGLPDLSKPPPGFADVPEVCPEDLLPSVPYYELPAGLMVPLIMLEDSDYRPLEPGSIRLPPPAPPSERLLAAVKAFYARPNHTRPQDSEGWEMLGLYEYYKAKNAVKKQKEDDIKSGLRVKSRSPTPVHLDYRSPPTRRYRSKSRSRSPSRSPAGSPERSSHRPGTGGAQSRKARRAQRAQQRSAQQASPSPSPSPSPARARSESPEAVGFRGSSPTNAGFGSALLMNASSLSELDSSNKGHQMLRRMGWGQGSGLGAAGQGIAAPIDAGIVRDKQDQYKGVGVNLNDPYENFRKNKGAAFITRIKERALERTT